MCHGCLRHYCDFVGNMHDGLLWSSFWYWQDYSPKNNAISNQGRSLLRALSAKTHCGELERHTREHENWHLSVTKAFGFGGLLCHVIGAGGSH